MLVAESQVVGLGPIRGLDRTKKTRGQVGGFVHALVGRLATICHACLTEHFANSFSGHHIVRVV